MLISFSSAASYVKSTTAEIPWAEGESTATSAACPAVSAACWADYREEKSEYTKVKKYSPEVGE